MRQKTRTPNAMPAHFIVRSIRPNNGIRQVHLSRMQGQPNEALFNLTSAVLADVFGAEVQEGDTWALHASLISRAGTNGTKRA